MVQTPVGAHKSLFRRFLTPLLYVIIGLFLIFYLQGIDYEKLRDTQLQPWLIILALLFAILTRYWGAFVWFMMLHGLGANDLSKYKLQLISVYAKSWLGRYIPGTAPWILGKIYFASKLGISKNKLAVSSMLEAGLQIVVILALSLIFLLLDSRFDVISEAMRALMTIMLVVCVVIMLPPVFNKFISLAYKVIRKKTLPVEDMVTLSTTMKGIVLFTVSALINGLSLFFIAKGVYPELPYSSLLFVASVGNLAGVLGMMAVFVPSGLGVREGVQLILLSTIMPVEMALVVTVVTRLLGVVADLLFFVMAWLHAKLFKA